MTYENEIFPHEVEDTKVVRDMARKKELTLSVTNVTLTASLGSAEVHHMYRTLPCFICESGQCGHFITGGGTLRSF